MLSETAIVNLSAIVVMYIDTVNQSHLLAYMKGHLSATLFLNCLSNI